MDDLAAAAKPNASGLASTRTIRLNITLETMPSDEYRELAAVGDSHRSGQAPHQSGDPGADRGTSGSWHRLRAVVATGLERSEEWLGRRTAGWLLLGLVGWIYTAAYLHHPLYPGHAPVESRQGWWSWSDQFAYWQSAAELAQFRLTAANYHYPLGYPALGALFWRFMPAHAFFVPDLLLVLGIAAVWWRLARIRLSRVLTLVVGIGLVVMLREVLLLTLVVPWNTIATQLTLMTGLWVMLTKQGPRTVWWLTGLAGLTYLVRPGDAACFAPMLVWAVLRLPAWRQRIGCALGGMAIIGAVVFGVGLVNRSVFGTWGTPYEHMTLQGIGFFSYAPLDKLFWVFVDGGPFFGESDAALLFRHPWLFLAVPALVFWVRTSGMAAVAAWATLVLNWLLYLNYNDFFPSGIYRFSLIHYLSWGFAPLFAMIAATVWCGWRQRTIWLGVAGAAVLAIFALGVQMEPRPLPAAVAPGRVDRLPEGRPLWVEFPGVAMEDVRWLRLDGRPMQETQQYQIPYVPADLRLLLGARAVGTSLAATPEANVTVMPRVGDYVWSWRFDWRRFQRGGR